MSTTAYAAGYEDAFNDFFQGHISLSVGMSAEKLVCTVKSGVSQAEDIEDDYWDGYKAALVVLGFTA